MNINPIFSHFGISSIIWDERPDIEDVEYEDITEEVNNRNKQLTNKDDGNQTEICEVS